MKKYNRLVILTGAPCAGKSTAGKSLMEELGCKRIRTCTTKPFSDDYEHVTLDKFNELSRNDVIIAKKFSAMNMYGLKKSSIYDAENSLDVGRFVVMLSPKGALDLMEFIKIKEIKLAVSCIVLSVSTNILVRRTIEKTLKGYDSLSDSNREEITEILSSLISDIEQFDHFRYYQDLNTLKEMGVIRLDDISLLDNAFSDSINNVLYFASRFFKIEV